MDAVSTEVQRDRRKGKRKLNSVRVTEISTMQESKSG